MSPRLIVVLLFLLSTLSWADPIDVGVNNDYRPLKPIREDAYGPNLNNDGAGRPFEWRTDSGMRPLGPVRQDVYGPGVGSDGTGAPVRAVPMDGANHGLR